MQPQRPRATQASYAAQPGAARRVRRREGLGWKPAALVMLGFVGFLWLLELVDAILPANLDAYGVRPRSVDGLDGILWAPLLHGGWLHLESNTVPLLVLGFVILLVAGLTRWLAVTAWSWLVGGLGIWLVAPTWTIHIGASVLVFGWFAYLAVAGFLIRRPAAVLLSVVVLLLYGGLIWGVLPGQQGISWQGHLFGALGGAIAAYSLHRRPRQAPAHR